ncbi:hypothetical protein HWA77_22125 [Photobacterium damselae subsp. damselae]|uniref:Uncharacterized protein n=1 Tax=Photobacterium damselae subsp. damselae TaxID=85581 RepID=A0A850R260_PHODD|nr:hypothetical protein [Photobacterium damselae subsp. damselae]
MQTSTVLYKNRRYKIKETNKVTNLFKHLYRHYNDRTLKDRKDDFNSELTENNLFINSDFTFIKNKSDWQQTVDSDLNDCKDKIYNLLNKVDNYYVNKNADKLTVEEKKKTRKAINYLSKMDLTEKDNEFSELYLLVSDLKDQALKIVNSKEKDYVLDVNKLKAVHDYYLNVDKTTKIKSLNAKKNNLSTLINNIDKMNEKRIFNESKQENAILFEERLFKIPKHNNKTLEPSHLFEIMKSWHNTHFKDFEVIKGFYHRDERSSGTDNPIDDHLHLLVSGFNKATKKYDLPDYTFNLSKRLAAENNIKFTCKSDRWNKADREEQVRSGEVLQEVFYKFANEYLKKHNYDYRFKINEKNEEELLKREMIKKFSHLPKNQRPFSMASYIEEQKNIEIQNLKKEHEIALINEKNKYTNKLEKDKKSILEKEREKLKAEKEDERKTIERQLNFEKSVKALYSKDNERLIKSNKELQEQNKILLEENTNLKHITKNIVKLVNNPFFKDIFRMFATYAEAKSFGAKTTLMTEYMNIIKGIKKINEVVKEEDKITIIDQNINDNNEIIFTDDEKESIQLIKNNNEESFFKKYLNKVKTYLNIIVDDSSDSTKDENIEKNEIKNTNDDFQKNQTKEFNIDDELKKIDKKTMKKKSKNDYEI